MGEELMTIISVTAIVCATLVALVWIAAKYGSKK